MTKTIAIRRFRAALLIGAIGISGCSNSADSGEAARRQAAREQLRRDVARERDEAINNSGSRDDPETLERIKTMSQATRPTMTTQSTTEPDSGIPESK